MDLVDVPVAKQWDAMVAAASVAEEAGFDSVWVYDHFHTTPEPTQESTFEAWTTMAGLAEATNRVRLGQMCTSNSYRNPAYLAKVASCIDVISGGRLELGIGAGWYEHEYKGYGYEFAAPKVRIGRLGEAVEMIKALWTEDEVTYHGKHYRLEGAINRPRPLQDPHPPIWIAGGGEQLTLRVVARHADRANFFGGDHAAFLHKRDVLERHCSDVGRQLGEIGLSRNFDCAIGESESEIAAKLERWQPTRGTLEDWKRVHLWGTPDRVAETLAGWRDEAGLDYAICYFVDATWGDGMRVFGEEVIPQLA